MNTFQSIFGSDYDKLKTFANDLKAYNAELETIYIQIIDEIRNSSGKAFNHFFAKRVTKSINQGLAIIIVDSSENKLNISFTDTHSYYYFYDIQRELRTTITFPAYKYICEDYVDYIVGAINYNRKLVAKYEDAAKHAKQQMKKVDKAIGAYLKAMQAINPVFADYNTFHIYEYPACKVCRNFDMHSYENKLNESVEKFVYPQLSTNL